MIDTSLFPYDSFPYRLEYGKKKDATICYFQCFEHLNKYLNRFNLKEKDVKVLCRDGKPEKPKRKPRTRLAKG